MTYDDKHDEFEDDEEFDDSDAFVRSTNGYVGDAEALLRRAIDIIASAPTMPLSSSPRGAQLASENRNSLPLFKEKHSSGALSEPRSMPAARQSWSLPVRIQHKSHWS